MAKYAGALRPIINGVSEVSGLAESGAFDQMLKRLHLRLNEQGLIDLQT